ncbi:MAG: AAA family ATPase [Gammaproteobacteria bacterium]|nr:AAA family ATPase [Gammaproteobacteria bacterium]
MILNSLRAENVLKYARLTLTRIPGRGIVAISGHNESGKSSIGETICFALFGRTFSLDAAHVAKIIRWGETRCSVAVDFRIGDEGYHLVRTLDNDGNHSARLSLAGEEGTPLARGVDGVCKALQELLGYDFSEFIESFYLAQREITTPHPHSEAVKIMAGLAPVERVIRELESEIGGERKGIEVAQLKIGGIDADLAELAIDPVVLGHLEEQRRADAEAENTLVELTESLEDAKSRYAANRPLIRAAKRAKSKAGSLAFLLFLVAAVLGGLWALLTQLPEHAVTKQIVDQLLVRALPDFAQRQGEYLQWALWGAAGAGALFLLSWIRGLVLGGRLSGLRETCGRLADALTNVHLTASQLDATAGGTATAPAGGRVEPTLDARASAGDEPPMGEVFLPEVERPDDDEVRRVARLIAADEAAEVEAEGLMARELAWVTHLSGERTRSLAELDRVIESERGRRAQGARLDGMRADLLAAVDTHGKRIGVREKAIELLRGAAQHISHRFNRDVRNLVGKTLPLFTDGRYEHLQIDSALNVRVFSADKRDFMDLDEISSGTQRQIMLALRLALSQQLLDRTVKGRQFVFLDEPFAFFDEARTRRALAELPGLSDDVQQIFIVAQSFPPELAGGFALHLECTRERDTMEA